MNITLNEKNSDFLNEATAQFLEKLLQHFGKDRVIEDVEWEVVYELKLEILKSFEMLGYQIDYELL